MHLILCDRMFKVVKEQNSKYNLSFNIEMFQRIL